jgi:hypothetical protein
MEAGDESSADPRFVGLPSEPVRRALPRATMTVSHGTLAAIRCITAGMSTLGPSASLLSHASTRPHTRPARPARAFVAAAAMAVAMAFAPSASANDIALAEKLFNDGLKAMETNDYVSACRAFAGSNEADPSPGTLMNLATCQEKQGKVASAWGSYQTAAGMADQRGQKERAATARAAASKLEPQLHKLVIGFKAAIPDEVTVTRNGVSVPKAALGSDIPVDPGEHAIEVVAKGKKKWTGRITVKAGPGTDRIEVPALEDEPVGATTPPPGGTILPPPAEAGTSSRGSTQRIIGGVVTGTGVAVGATALVFQIMALSQDSKSKTTCALPREQDIEDACTSQKDAAKANQAVAIGLGIGGALAIGVGLTLIFTAPSGPAKTAKIRILPDLGPNGGSLSLGGSF